MMTGNLPFREDVLDESSDFRGMLDSNPHKFWKFHKKYSSMNIHSPFRDLFEKMVDPNPRVRASISDIKNSEWFNGPTCSPKQLKEAMAMFEFSKIGCN